MNNKMRYGKTNLLLFAMVFIGLIVIFSNGMGNVSAASGNTVYVNASSGLDTYDGLSPVHTGTSNAGPKATIKNGVGVVTTNGTLNIADGQYTGTDNTQITINNNMTIKGQSQKNTIINGQHINWIFFINPGCNVNIKNLTITNGNTTQVGGAIYNKGNLTVTSSTFIGNTATQDAGAIWNYEGNLTVTGSTFNNNTAYGGGGAIGNNGGTLNVTDSTFKNNTAIIGGAICSGSIITVSDSTFTGNTATQDGNGGAICSGGNLTVTGSIFNNNTAYSGGAIGSMGILTVTGSIFNNNTAQYGGAINNQGRTLTVTDSRFTGNTATQFGGAICSGLGTLTVTDSTFADNNATSGSGGAIFYYGNTLTVKGSTFTNNNAPYGGAISSDDGYAIIILNVICSTFANNTATGDGGAIYNVNSGTLNVTGSTFTNNNAPNGGAVYTANGCTLNVTSSTFTNNTAAQYGGAIYNKYGTYVEYGAVNAVFNRFYKNTAGSGGDAIYTNGNSFTADNNWWGSNNPDFVSLTGSTVTPTKWLVLRFLAITPLTYPGPVLSADLTWNNLNQQTTVGYLANGTPVIFSMHSGQGSVNPTNTTTQNGTANSTFNTTLLGTAATVNVTVDDETLSQDITLNPAKSDLTGRSSSGNYIGSKIISATLHGEQGNPIEGATVIFKLNGGTIGSTVTDSNGIATLPNLITLTPGTYNITTEYSGDVNYENCTGSETIQIPRSNTFMSVNGTPILNNGTTTLTSVLHDCYGQPLANMNVDFYVNNIQVKTGQTDSNGVVSVLYGPVNLAVGNYNLTANYQGNSLYLPFIIQGILTIKNPVTVIQFDPISGAVNVLANKVIKLTFSEPIKAGNMWIELKNSSGKLITITKTISANVLIINHSTPLTTGKYTLTLHTGSIIDLTGNPLALKVSSFTVDNTPPKVSSTTPTNLKTGVSRTNTIAIKFSENIKASNYYNNIKVKNLTTGKYVTITKSITGNTLYIKMTLTRIPYNWYQVTIPTKTIKDYAGNNLLATYTFKFKTGA